MKKTERLTKKKIEELLEKKNVEHDSHFELFGSWQTKGYSDNDIDIKSSVDGEDKNLLIVNDIGSHIAKETGMLTEIHFVFDYCYFKDFMNSVMRYYPDGRSGYIIDFVMPKEIDRRV